MRAATATADGWTRPFSAILILPLPSYQTRAACAPCSGLLSDLALELSLDLVLQEP